jgi:ATP-dependent DNA helicase DinG
MFGIELVSKYNKLEGNFLEYIVVDLETTGLDGNVDKITEIGAVKIKHGIIVETFHSLVKPNCIIPPQITKLTGINNEMVADAPDFKTILNSFNDFCTEANYFIAHNAIFEKNFLNKSLPEKKWLDSIEIAKIVHPLQKSYSLSSLLEFYKIEHKDAHRALGDAKATAELFLLLLDDLYKLPLPLWQNFSLLSQGLNTPLAQFIQTESRNILRKLNFDETKNFINIHNIFGEQAKKEEPKEEANLDWQLPYETIDNFFAEFTQNSKGLQLRPQQLEMSKKVAQAFNDKQCLLAEGGTGTGKSLAYLLPAVLYAKGSKAPVAISTHTINLQEQLWQKDIPMLKQLLKTDFKTVLVKGRSNYVCLRKWRELPGNFPSFRLSFFLRVASWLQKTKTGDYNEMSLSNYDYENWQFLAANSESCNISNCRYKNLCYVNRIRKEAEKADILVLNHSLLLASSFMKEWSITNILPSLPYLIIDEAHHLNSVAEEQLTASFSLKSLDRALAHLWRHDRLSTTLKQLRKLTGLKGESQLLTLTETMVTTVDELKISAKESFALCRKFLQANAACALTLQLRITNQRASETWEPLENSLSNTIFVLQKLIKELREICKRLADTDDPYFSIDLVADFNMTLNALETENKNAQTIIDDKDNTVIWLEMRNCDDFPLWYIAPVDVREALAEFLYEDKQGIVMTSATLTSQGSFDYFKSLVGLDISPLPVYGLQLVSTFDYESQVKFFVCEDVPDFQTVPEIEAVDHIVKALVPLLKAAGGRTLVLFTSHNQLKASYKALTKELDAGEINILAHGISGSRDYLLSQLRKNSNTCILGAYSFWEGIDVIGDALSLVILVRLPFAPPNTPTMEARTERLLAQGKNPFRALNLPQAIIRFKQGFGRLIRSENDRGIFCVLDKRIYEKRYGKSFIKSLPVMEIKRGSAEKIACFIKEWL